MRSYFKKAPPLLLLSLSLPLVSHATPVPVVSAKNCSTSTVNISSIEPKLGGGPIGNLTYPIDSTSCLGYVITPDNDGPAENPDPNKGALGDGLLNEEVFFGHYVPGDYFLTNVNDSMVDLDGDGDKTDPGWIRLGGSETGDNAENWSITYDFIGDYDLDQVLDITFGVKDGMGYWTLDVDPSAIIDVSNALGRPTVFDHLAFVFKGPNGNGQQDSLIEGEWAVYDFNFYDLIDAGLDISLGDTAYYFEGEWDANIFGGQNVSHMSIWAHDPPLSNRIPLPSTLALMALCFLGLRFGSRRAGRDRT